MPRSNEFIVTAHASFIDHRLGNKSNSTRQYMVEYSSQLSVESFIENTHVDNESVPRVNGGQTLSSTKGLSTGNNHNETVPAVNTGVYNEFV